MATISKLVTYDDYRTLPDDGKRYEIIGGELYMTPAPTTYHQRILGNLYMQMRHFTDKSNLGEVLMAPVDIVLSMTDVIQPDLIYIAKSRAHIITRKNIVAAPDLVVEIISESTEAIDQNQKKQLYERYGVKEYWLVYPEKKQVEQFILRDQAFTLQNTYQVPDSLKSNILSGFSVELKNIFVG
ncbi:MAG TPA: Uma2 family endonuclease [Balneolaceae bacterium]|nr:Uma2 family endonuclease [Balneolaceae bacterium]